MGYTVKIQQIIRKDFNQYYINFPSTIAKAIKFSKSKPIEWEIADKDTPILKRKKVGSVTKKRV